MLLLAITLENTADLQELVDQLLAAVLRRASTRCAHPSLALLDQPRASFDRRIVSSKDGHFPIRGSWRAHFQQPKETPVVETTMEEEVRTFETIFSRAHVQAGQVIGQVDCKFIAASFYLPSAEARQLVLLDQHAVDERIRLEEMLEGDPLSATRLTSSPLYLERLSPRVVQTLREAIGTVEKWGFRIVFLAGGTIALDHVPQCLTRRHREVLPLFADLAQWSTLFEALSAYIESGATALIPSPIFELLQSKACRGAIMFGDALTLPTMKRMLQQLARCRYPFQCAHGRPSIAPLCALEQRTLLL